LVLHSGRVPVLNAWLVRKDKGMMIGERVKNDIFPHWQPCPAILIQVCFAQSFGSVEVIKKRDMMTIHSLQE
jgi:hypothetical protein